MNNGGQYNYTDNGGTLSLWQSVVDGGSLAFTLPTVTNPTGHVYIGIVQANSVPPVLDAGFDITPTQEFAENTLMCDGGFQTRNTVNRGSAGATNGTITATVMSNAVCGCWDIASGATVQPCRPTVSGTTLTCYCGLTGAQDAGADLIEYLCN